jgi:hypothetical protein
MARRTHYQLNDELDKFLGSLCHSLRDNFIDVLQFYCAPLAAEARRGIWRAILRSFVDNLVSAAKIYFGGPHEVARSMRP